MKELRRKYNLTQKGLSLLTKIPITTIQQWEQGRRNPPEYIKFLIEKYLESLEVYF